MLNAECFNSRFFNCICEVSYIFGSFVVCEYILDFLVEFNNYCVRVSFFIGVWAYVYVFEIDIRFCLVVRFEPALLWLPWCGDLYVRWYWAQFEY